MPGRNLDEREDRKHLAELEVVPEAEAVGRDAMTAFSETQPSFEVFEIVGGTHILYPDTNPTTLSGGDVLPVKGTADDLVDGSGGRSG
ncbi:MAG: hypothetical protein ACLFN9_23160, partial [Desulfococcaceae bacterium]